MIRIRPLLLALLALGACTSPKVNTVESGDSEATSYQKVVFSDRLDEKVGIEKVKKDVKDGFLRAQVELRNSTRDKATFEYAFEWFDEAGMQVAPTTSIWTQATIFPGETRSFLATAGSRAATDFRFKVKLK